MRCESPSLRQTISLFPPSKDCTDWSTPHLMLSSLDCARPKWPCRKVETEVRNGDCLAACFCAALQYLNEGRVSSQSLVEPAARLRADLVGWIKENWFEYPLYNPSMTVYEIVHMQHALGVTEDELQSLDDWGQTPEEQLAAYERKSKDIYFSDAEMMLFACWLWEKRSIVLMFRVYRGDDPSHVVDTPSPSLLSEMGVNSAVIIELDHTGPVDSRAAHYRLIEGGSLVGISQGFAPRAPPKATVPKKKRPVLLGKRRVR